MKCDLTLQKASSNKSIPKKIFFNQCIDAALDKKLDEAEITVRIVDKEEMQALNHKALKKDYPTNVLAFPLEKDEFFLPEEMEHYIGDIVICAGVVDEEAKSQNKSSLAHWAHLIVHGTLHLIGYDHIKEDEAEIMEQEEINILAKLGYENPYQ
ncbi:MAG: rRNA maturation RNase YbeY [Gammaproteobacteria bacterium]